MELPFERQTLSYLARLLDESHTQEETAEVIVPDAEPDAGSILFTSASVLLRGKENRTGSILLSGAIRASALYGPEDGSQPRCVDTYIPFSMRVDAAALTQDTETLVQLFVRQADARLINSRKLLFRVELGCRLRGFEPREETLCHLKQPPEGLEQLTQTYPLGLALAAGEKSFVLSDETELPQLSGERLKICAYETTPELTDCKIVGQRAVFKGNLLLKALLQSGDQLSCLERRFPFSQYCELGQDLDEEALSVVLSVSSAELEPDTTGGKLLISAGLTAQCLATGIREVSLVQDAYPVNGTLEPQWKDYSFNVSLDEKTVAEPLRSQLRAEADQILCVQAYAGTVDQRRDQGELVLSAPIKALVLYRDAEGTVRGTGETLTVSTRTALNDQARCSAFVTLSELSASAAGGGIELRGDVRFAMDFTAQQELRGLCGGTYEARKERDPERPSVVLRRVQERRSLWELAKEYGSTTRSIQSANELSGQEAEAGSLLLIPM